MAQLPDIMEINSGKFIRPWTRHHWLRTFNEKPTFCYLIPLLTSLISFVFFCILPQLVIKVLLKNDCLISLQSDLSV